MGDGPAGGVGGDGERAAQMVRVVSGGQDPRHPAQQLGQDRAGVAAGTDQGAVRHGPYRVGRDGRGRSGLMGGEDRFDGLGRGLDGQIEVGPGVPVGHGVHIDRVDRLALAAQRLQGQ